MDAAPAQPPAYHKPTEPGIWMNFDNTVSIYHVVQASDDFEHAAQGVFRAVAEAQRRYPDWPRVFYLDIRGHEGMTAGFDEDFVEFQQEFWFSAVAPFLTAFDLPLTGPLANPSPQRGDVPDRLVIGPGTSGEVQGTSAHVR